MNQEAGFVLSFERVTVVTFASNENWEIPFQWLRYPSYIGNQINNLLLLPH